MFGTFKSEADTPFSSLWGIQFEEYGHPLIDSIFEHGTVFSYYPNAIETVIEESAWPELSRLTRQHFFDELCDFFLVFHVLG